MFAYIGPAGALSVIGSFLALVGGIALAVLGFAWYPLKRYLRARRAAAAASHHQSDHAQA